MAIEILFDGRWKMEKVEFERILIARLNGENYKTKHWTNYPNSVFYYYKDDDIMQNEIAIYTNERTYQIYI